MRGIKIGLKSLITEDTFYLILESVLNTTFIAPQSGDWGDVVIKYGRIMAIHIKRESTLFLGQKIGYSRVKMNANLLRLKK